MKVKVIICMLTQYNFCYNINYLYLVFNYKHGKTCKKMNLPKISVNIPLIENGSAEIVLDSLKKVDYPARLFEIIIIKGNNLAKQRNEGVKNSKCEIIYLLDDDSQVQPNSFITIAKEFQDMNVAVVGGPTLPPKNGNYINQLMGYILETYFGAFRMRYKWSKQPNSSNTIDYQFIAANLAIRKEAVLEIGGFDERFYPSEETDLVRRIKNKGYKVKYSDKLIVFQNHKRKNSYLISERFFHYGEGRMRQILKNPIKEDFIFILPIGFSLYLLSLVFFNPFWYFLPIVIYLILGLLTSLKAALKYKKYSLIFLMTVIYPIVHLSYAMGLINGFIINFRKYKYYQSSNIKTRLIIIKVLNEVFFH